MHAACAPCTPPTTTTTMREAMVKHACVQGGAECTHARACTAVETSTGPRAHSMYWGLVFFCPLERHKEAARLARPPALTGLGRHAHPVRVDQPPSPTQQQHTHPPAPAPRRAWGVRGPEHNTHTRTPLLLSGGDGPPRAQPSSVDVGRQGAWGSAALQAAKQEQEAPFWQGRWGLPHRHRTH